MTDWTPTPEAIEAMKVEMDALANAAALDCLLEGKHAKNIGDAAILIAARAILGVPALLAENTRLRALLVAEKRAHADLLDAADMVSGFTCGEGSRPLRAEADAIERGEG